MILPLLFLFAPPPAQAVDSALKRFTEVLAAIEREAADPLSSGQAIYQGAIPGMLRTLDPHSNFFDPKAYALLREGQSGHYYGVGMFVGATPKGTWR